MGYSGNKNTLSLALGPWAPRSPFSPFILTPGSPCIRTQKHWILNNTCHELYYVQAVLDTCSLTLGPGIPCSPWKALSVVSMWQLKVQKTNITSFYQEWNNLKHWVLTVDPGDPGTPGGPGGPGGPGWEIIWTWAELELHPLRRKAGSSYCQSWTEVIKRDNC